MLYVIIGEDNDNSLEKRMQARPQHLERLNALKEQGRMLLAGPFPAIDSPDPGPAGFSGSVIVAEFDSLEAAGEWIAADPYVTSGVFAKVTVKPFRKGFPR